MEVYCTRPLQPNEAPHQNSIPKNLVGAAFNDDEVMRQLQDLRCETCQMPLVLDHARYVPIEEIGQGGFGRVFLVLDRRFNLRKRAAIDQSAPSNAQTAPVTCGTDPETVVFWNNTKAILRGNPLTIAVSLPLGDPAWRGAANEMLTGVAQVQQDFNSAAANNRLLQVILTRDNNDGKVSTQIAQLVMNNQIPADASNSSNDSMLTFVRQETPRRNESGGK